MNNKKLKILIGTIVVSVILLVLDLNYMYLGKFLYQLFPCVDANGTSFPCYGTYDIYFVLFLILVIVISLILLLGKGISKKENRRRK